MAEVEIRSHDRILLKALALFSNRGYDATSVREICEAAGVTKPTLYHFYGSKEGVYRALVEGTLDEYRHGVRAIVEASGSVPGAPEADRPRPLRSTRSERPELVRFLAGADPQPPGLGARAPTSTASTTRCSRNTPVSSSRASRTEPWRPAPSWCACSCTRARIIEAIHGYLLAGRPELTPELADTLVDTILRGWSAPITA